MSVCGLPRRVVRVPGCWRDDRKWLHEGCVRPARPLRDVQVAPLRPRWGAYAESPVVCVIFVHKWVNLCYNWQFWLMGPGL